MSTFLIILFTLLGVGLIMVLSRVFKKKPEIVAKEEEEDENDELVFDEVTGKYLTVEELVNEHQLDYLDDTKVEKVYSGLPQEIKESTTLKDVEAILEFHYRVEALKEEEELEEEVKVQMIRDIFIKKGKPINNELIMTVFDAVKPT